MKNKGQRWYYLTIAIHPNKKRNTPDEFGNTLKPNNHHKHRLKTFDFPDYIIQKRQWYFDLLVAKYQVRFPRHLISKHICPYYPSDNDPVLIKKRQISAAKAQVTRVENIIKHREKELFAELFSDNENDPLIKKARVKLEEKKLKLNQLIQSNNPVIQQSIH